MSLGMYQMTVPVLTAGLRNLSAYLEKGRGDAVSRGYEPQTLLQSRLAPDMFPLVRQVQIATDMAKGAAARLAGLEAPSFPDTETDFDQIQDRIGRTVTFIETATEAMLAGSEDRTVVLKFPGMELTFTGADYLTKFVYPNFYFHLATAYALLRHNGVRIGKMDFLGA